MIFRPHGRNLTGHYLVNFVVACLLLSILPLSAQPTHTRLIYSHSLLNATPAAGETIVNSGGLFISDKGWQSNTDQSQLTITLADPLPFEGTCLFDVTNFDPPSQWVDDLKLHIFNLYSRIYSNNKDIFETDGSWCNIRTGSGYSAGAGMGGYKMLAAPRGLATRDEDRYIEDHTWDRSRTYTFKIIWTRSLIYTVFDGVLQGSLPFSGQIEPFKYLLIGRDNLIWGYCAQPGAIFSNVRIYGKSNPTVQLSSRLYLEGAYDSRTGKMSTALRCGQKLPLQSPYAQAPYVAASLPINIVDWLLLTLRQTATGNSVLSRSLWLREDGKVIDPQSGGEVLSLPIDSGIYFVGIQHRNHLAALSRAALLFDGVSTVTCNFSDSLGCYYNRRGAVQMAAGVWALQGGDVNGDRSVNLADYTVWQSAARSGETSYHEADVNLDTYTTSEDYVLWYGNNRLGASSGMP